MPEEYTTYKPEWIDKEKQADSKFASFVMTGITKSNEELQKRGRGDIMVIAGGVIPAQDYQFLKDHGAAAIYGPGTPIPFAAKDMLEILNQRLDEEE